MNEIENKNNHFLTDGDDLTLLVRLISGKLENLIIDVKKHNDILNAQYNLLQKNTDKINHIDQESVKARNQIVYMLLTLIFALLGKILFTTEYFIGK